MHEERLQRFHRDLKRRGLGNEITEVYKVMSDLTKVGVSREGSRCQGLRVVSWYSKRLPVVQP